MITEKALIKQVHAGSRMTQWCPTDWLKGKLDTVLQKKWSDWRESCLMAFLE